MCPFSQHMNAETINIHTWVWRSTHERHFIQYGLLRTATSKKCSKPNKNQTIAFKVSLSPNCSFNSTELLKLYKKIGWQVLNDKCCHVKIKLQIDICQIHVNIHQARVQILTFSFECHPHALPASDTANRRWGHKYLAQPAQKKEFIISHFSFFPTWSHFCEQLMDEAYVAAIETDITGKIETDITAGIKIKEEIKRTPRREYFQEQKWYKQNIQKIIWTK